MISTNIHASKLKFNLNIFVFNLKTLTFVLFRIDSHFSKVLVSHALTSDLYNNITSTKIR
jgi:hypothetical protein